ncbi:MAG: hypothetical protein Q7R52_01565 [archaeon]|nr:hypothetical protein [archaeon]
MSEKFEKEVIERLDLVVKLLSRMNINQDSTQTESIIQLSKIGLRPNQIADTLNTSQNYVNLILSKNRKEGK